MWAQARLLWEIGWREVPSLSQLCEGPSFVSSQGHTVDLCCDSSSYPTSTTWRLQLKSSLDGAVISLFPPGLGDCRVLEEIKDPYTAAIDSQALRNDCPLVTKLWLLYLVGSERAWPHPVSFLSQNAVLMFMLWKQHLFKIKLEESGRRIESPFQEEIQLREPSPAQYPGFKRTSYELQCSWLWHWDLLGKLVGGGIVTNQQYKQCLLVSASQHVWK